MPDTPPTTDPSPHDEPLAPVPPEVDAVVPPTSVAGKAAHFLLGRYPVWPIVAYLSKKSVPRHRHSFWYGMGGLALFFLGVQILTGILLMVYYHPSQPWSSVQHIVNEVPFGNVIRSIHHWSANLLVFTLFLHLASTFFMKAYRRPRELTWLTGLGLLGLALGFCFSGYLLPWDGLAFFATRVGVSEMEKMPLVGHFAANLIRGGDDISVGTIGRFFTLHVIVLPLALLGLVGLHVLFVQIQGVSEPDSFRALPPEKKRYHSFFGGYLINEIPVWLLALVVLIALAAFLPHPLNPEADPTAPAAKGIKPEWYFLAQYQLLKLFPGKLELLGMAAMGLAPLLVAAVPFFDREIPSGRTGRRVAWAGAAGLLGLVVLTLWGYVS